MDELIYLYCIYDKQLQYYYTPLPAYHDKEIMKEMRNLVNDDKTIMHSNPDGFEMYCVGEFDYNTGNITPCLRLVSTFADLLTKEVNNE